MVSGTKRANVLSEDLLKQDIQSMSGGTQGGAHCRNTPAVFVTERCSPPSENEIYAQHSHATVASLKQF